jgi:hypothetical protein
VTNEHAYTPTIGESLLIKAIRSRTLLTGLVGDTLGDDPDILEIATDVPDHVIDRVVGGTDTICVVIIFSAHERTTTVTIAHEISETTTSLADRFISEAPQSLEGDLEGGAIDTLAGSIVTLLFSPLPPGERVVSPMVAVETAYAIFGGGKVVAARAVLGDDSYVDMKFVDVTNDVLLKMAEQAKSDNRLN